MWKLILFSSLLLICATKIPYVPAYDKIKLSKPVPECHLQQYIFNIKLPVTEYSSSRMKRCPSSLQHMNNTVYILYDVNPPEGFNLRRDVYIRLAVFARQLQRSKHLYGNLRLVLPPWRRLYHWKSSYLQQENLPWSTFFDLESMRRYAPILDFPEFLEEISHFGLQESPYVPVHKIFQLLHFEDMFENGVFHDKFEFAPECHKDQYLHGNLLQQSILLDNELWCVHFQGSANLLGRLLRSAVRSMSAASSDVKVFALLNAEIVLHDHWGDEEFWRARRSMRFAEPLVAIAEDFRLMQFNATNRSDRVQRPPMWEAERADRSARGGSYLCAHVRRGDFVYGRDKTTPTLKSIATQIKEQLQQLNLTTVFIATDASAFEITNLRSYLQRVRVVRFTAESLEQKARLKDGGIAIIDQLICAHAQYFIGTYESTFTYRIYEEREILGFPQSTTFNTFCKSATLENCVRNSNWPIRY